MRFHLHPTANIYIAQPESDPIEIANQERRAEERNRNLPPPPAPRPPAPTSLGAMLASGRELRRMSRSQVAETVGVQLETCARWERNEALPGIKNLLKLIALLHLDRQQAYSLSRQAKEAQERALPVRSSTHTLADAIREARGRKRLSQMTLSGLIDASQTTVALWETGRSIPQVKHLNNLIELLSMDRDATFDLWRQAQEGKR